MYDVHNHVLPGVDDGPADTAAALRMLEIAAQQGITHVACTPHASDRAGERTDRLLQSVFLQLKDEAANSIPVELMLASELMLGPNVLHTLAFPFATYGGAGRYVLLEFPTETPFEIVLNAVRSVRRTGKWTLIAHFERFARAQRKAEQPQALRAAGAILTVDAGSPVGQFGAVMTRRARQLLKWECVDILASDAHDGAAHGFCLRAGYEAAAEIIGAQAAQVLVMDNPRRVWEGLPWVTDEAGEGKSAG